ncbi:MAG: hypothetical protein P8X74_13505 [Reinekea sp.]
MDRHNWNFSNAYYYNHDNYSQAYQGNGQHTSQPETGQTSGGVAASGPSWSYPTPSQPQSYPDYNFSQGIPISLGSDWEYLLRSPQPTPLEDILQNDVRSNAQSAVKTPQRRCFTKVKEDFLASLDQYAQGCSLSDCSATIRYVTDAGHLKPKGTTLYNKLEQEDKDRVDRALEDRKVFNTRKPYSDNSTRTRILEGLEAYASGTALKECSATIQFSGYFSTDGRLLQAGERLYDGLKQEDKDRIDQALKDRKENSDKARTSFLNGLEAYANGALLKECSETIQFDLYVSAKGYLHERGKLLCERLEQGDKDRVNNALRARQKIHVERITINDTPMDDFLGGLEAYASGVPLRKCSASSRYYSYVTSDGRLRGEGQRLYDRLVGREGKALVNKALAERRRKAAENISGDIPHFLAALEPYGNGQDLKECGSQLGLTKRERYLKVERYLTLEGGLTPKGELLIENLPPNEQLNVLNKVRLRRQSIDPSAQVPVPPWQLHSPMPEMGGMNQAEMVDPMQTEAMWATAWQMTGQAMPGPSPSAELPIPYYNREAIGADFQHPLWPLQADSTERTGPSHQPGNHGPYADQYPGRGA